MKQTISGTWVFMLVIFFTLIFAAYIALTINYSKSFKVKNEVLSLIEKNEGFTDNGVKLINNYLTQTGYKTMGACHLQPDTVVYGAKTIDPSVPAASAIEKVNSSKNQYYYCFTKYTNYHSYFKTRAYYKINLFFHFDLPVLGDLYSFDVEGQTSEIDATYDSNNLTDWMK